MRTFINYIIYDLRIHYLFPEFVSGSITCTYVSFIYLPVFDTTSVFITVQYIFIVVKMENLLTRK